MPTSTASLLFLRQSRRLLLPRIPHCCNSSPSTLCRRQPLTPPLLLRRTLSSYHHPPPPPSSFDSDHISSTPFQTRPPPPPNYQSPFGSSPTSPTSTSHHDSHAKETRRLYSLTLGAVGGMVALWLVASMIDTKPDKADSQVSPNWGKGVEILLGEQKPGEVVDSGTSRVPGGFPRRVFIPRTVGAGEGAGKSGNDGNDEYVLLGHGIRTVSFLRVQVYVVGLYVHINDLPTLSARLAAAGTTTTEQQKDVDLYTPAIITPPVRSLIRIVPTRNTDWIHMRDGFIRAILANQPGGEERSHPTTPPSPSPSSSLNNVDESFSTAMSTFKSLFSPNSNNTTALPRSVPSNVPIYLIRGSNGELRVLFDVAKGEVKDKQKVDGIEKGLMLVGNEVVSDPRISAALWTGYVGPGKVASEEMRGRVWKRLEALRRGEGIVGSG